MISLMPKWKGLWSEAKKMKIKSHLRSEDKIIDLK